MSRMWVVIYAVYAISIIGKVTPMTRRFPSLIVFGDSLLDCGMNNYVKTIAKGNFPPYGKDFEGGIPTGRFSNGKVPSDLIAEKLGIKEYTPPYLDPTLQIEDLLSGVDFASGDAGYDPLSSFAVNALSLVDQLRFFKEYIQKLDAAVGEKRRESVISDSLYLTSVGTNDIINNYYSKSTFRHLQYDINSYTDLMASFASAFFQDLYKLGARTIAIINLPPLGCLPAERTLGGGPQRDCVEKYNQAATIFNLKLVSVIQSLNSRLVGAMLVYLDLYEPVLDLINYPEKEGFAVVDKGCCGTGLREASISCNPFVLGTCKNVSRYVFFDAYHPTQRGYEIIVDRLLINPRFFS